MTLFLSCLHAPAVIGLVHHTGDEGDDILAAVIQHGNIVLADLRHGIDFVGPGSQLSCQLDGITHIQRVDLSEVVGHASVVGRQRRIARKEAGYRCLSLSDLQQHPQ